MTAAPAKTQTLDDIKATLAADAKKGDGTDIAMARTFARFGNGTAEAKEYARGYAAARTV